MRLHWDNVRWHPEPVLRLKRSRYKKKNQPGTKNRKTRAMLMTPRLAEALRTLPRARRQTHVLVRRDELPMTPKAIQLRLEKAEAGPGLNPKLHRPKP